jgi:hypothetical protein
MPMIAYIDLAVWFGLPLFLAGFTLYQIIKWIRRKDK